MNNIDDFVIKEAEKKAKDNLKGYIEENQIGYVGALRNEIKKILKEQGIDWIPDDGERSID